jgi:hypothetical protein
VDYIIKLQWLEAHFSFVVVVRGTDSALMCQKLIKNSSQFYKLQQKQHLTGGKNARGRML